MIELVTMFAALVAAATGTFLTAAVARNLWAERQQRRALERMAADQAVEPPDGHAPAMHRLSRRERRARARRA